MRIYGTGAGAPWRDLLVIITNSRISLPGAIAVARQLLARAKATPGEEDSGASAPPNASRPTPMRSASVRSDHDPVARNCGVAA